ncbi:MAG: hypothetical protein ACI8RA_002558, partial [Chlamydiales bacterium]
GSDPRGLLHCLSKLQAKKRNLSYSLDGDVRPFPTASNWELGEFLWTHTWREEIDHGHFLGSREYLRLSAYL